jgi:hypothetical protein
MVSSHKPSTVFLPKTTIYGMPMSSASFILKPKDTPLSSNRTSKPLSFSLLYISSALSIITPGLSIVGIIVI